MNRIIIPLLVLFTTLVQAADQDVRQHGAAGNGTTLDSAAFQAAIDTASAGGGGVVQVPPGRYLVAHVALKSNVTLHLDKGTMLLGSTHHEYYSTKAHDAVLVANSADHICIEGEGEIDGQITGNLTSHEADLDGHRDWRTEIIKISKCQDVTIRSVTLRNSDIWTVVLQQCEHVRIDGITIRNNLKRIETDGIDINSCNDAKIARCHISTGDDAICLKSFKPSPCENVEVGDCVIESATAALKFGTSTETDFRHICFHDCQIVNSPVGVGFYMKDGGVAQDVMAENIDMQICPVTVHSTVPLFIDIEKRNADSKISGVRDVTFQNIHITGEAGLLLQGMPERFLENITLRNISFDVKNPQDYVKRRKPVGGKRTTQDERDTKYARMPTYAALASIKNLTVDGLHLNITDTDYKQFPRSALALFSVDGAQISGVTRSPASVSPAVIEQSDCKQVRVTPAVKDLK